MGRQQTFKGRKQMIAKNPIWLPHLTSDVLRGARKTKLCAYTVALEGWRRGLKLKWYTREADAYKDLIVFGVNPPGRLFSLSSEKRTHYFFRTRGDLVTNEAVEIGSNKDQTKAFLEKAGVPHPKAKMFDEDAADEEIVAYARTLGFPLVVKPTDGSLGRGVVTNIQNEAELKKALNYVRVELEYPKVLLEQHIPGEEYRVYVVGDKAVGAYNRIPANVTGDGKHTIAELIEIKNEERKKNQRLYNCLIEIDQEIIDFIQSAGYTLDSIPKRGKRLFLREKSNISTGGDPIDVTDQLPDAVKQVAVDAVKAIPGLLHGGVDIIIDDSKPGLHAYVIELNPTAQIGGILFPLEGQARDIPAAIIDYYFPETIDKPKPNVYFDLNNVLEPLQSRSAIEVEVAPAPAGNLYARKYTVTGKVNRVRFHKWLRREAFERNLNGYAKKLDDNVVEIVVAGTNKNDVTQFKGLLTRQTDKADIWRIREEPWKEPVKVGFEISEDSLRTIKSQLKKIEKDMRTLEKQRERMELETMKIPQSRSWRYTLPIRKIGDFVKNLLGLRSVKF